MHGLSDRELSSIIDVGKFKSGLLLMNSSDAPLKVHIGSPVFGHKLYTTLYMGIVNRTIFRRDEVGRTTIHIM